MLWDRVVSKNLSFFERRSGHIINLGHNESQLSLRQANVASSLTFTVGTVTHQNHFSHDLVTSEK